MANVPSAPGRTPPDDTEPLAYGRDREMSVAMVGPRILVVGYAGANNTGAEALLHADVDDLRAVTGGDLHMTIPALDAGNLRRYLREGPDLEIVQIPMIFVPAITRLVRAADVVVLVEGSAYMDTWTSALLWYFLWATYRAHVEGKPCLAYAVDAGGLSPVNRELVRRVASSTDLIVARSAAAAARLRGWGVTAPLVSTADNALTFAPDPEEVGWVQRAWPDARDAPVGIAPVDFFRFPVVIRPWGRDEDRYRWPYFFASSPGRRRASALLSKGYARLADRIVETHGHPVALIAMEELDEALCRAIHVQMRRRDRARIFSAREDDASRITWLLRSLRMLVTSRYHAAILSLAAGIPQIAVGHDLRLSSLYEELGIEGAFLRPTSPDVFTELDERVDALFANPLAQDGPLSNGYREHLGRAERNRTLLRSFLAEHGWGVERWAA